MTTAAAPRSLTVLGGGPAGYPAAFLAADLGAAVTLIEEAPTLGGTCLHHGCIPSKCLLHAARVMEESQAAARLGLQFLPPAIELERLREWKNSVCTRLAQGLAQLANRRGIEILQARARFASPTSLHLCTAGGGARQLSFETLLLASGSAPLLPAGWPTEHPRFWDSRRALELPEIPPRLLVLGGGYIGLELATIYAALGSRVTIVEVTDSLLPGLDRDLVAPLARRLHRQLETIYLQSRVADWTETSEGLVITIEHIATGEIRQETFSVILAAMGRRPRTETLELTLAGLTVRPSGFLPTDEAGRTRNPRILAAGDLTGPPLLAHKATAEACAAIHHWGGRPARTAAGIPAVVYTDPEIATVGLSESHAAQEKIPVKISKFPWTASGRALTLGRTEGFTKILTDPATGKLLGAGIVGVGAGELITEVALAMEMKATAKDLGNVIPPHPTLSETLAEAAHLTEDCCIHWLDRKSQ